MDQSTRQSDLPHRREYTRYVLYILHKLNIVFWVLGLALVAVLVVWFAQTHTPLAYGQTVEVVHPPVVIYPHHSDWFKYETGCSGSEMRDERYAAYNPKLYAFANHGGYCYESKYTFDLSYWKYREITSATLIANMTTNTSPGMTTSPSCTAHRIIDVTADTGRKTNIGSGPDCGMMEIPISTNVINDARAVGSIGFGFEPNNHLLMKNNQTARLSIVSPGTNCMYVQASQMCGFFHDPWFALKQVMGEPYVGDWFYLMVFVPIPMVIYLGTRNGTYAGFSCMPIMLVIHRIDPLHFEVALSMIAIAAGFMFYEIMRKRLFAQVR